MGKKKFVFSIILCLALLSIMAIFSISLGAKSIAFTKVIDVLLGNAPDSLEATIILQRIPRTVFGILAGGALGISGALMQSITRNPIADPSILGVNTGASLFVVAGIAFFNITVAYQYIWLAIIGAGVTAVFVYSVASMGKDGATPLKLALSGSAVSIVLGSLVSTIMLPNNRVMEAFRFWQVGSIGSATWENIMLISPFLIVGFIISMFISGYLNNLALGDEAATALGTNVVMTRTIGALSSVLLCGATTALAGPIGFVGLIIPHIIRLIFGSEMSKMLPLSFLGSAILMLVSDIIGRIISLPGETEVGIVTAVIGAPVFILAIRKGRVKSL
ncbi:FecCD family ABC transporter permease [Catonella massiliensis]|uniref:Iron chelate uptake ABC transporter family permease subunit n=1 Tax=Catonella massiliensis TaxID=2799636 RepID=A0ABS1IYK7_9FIRM|nr:iron chelate uptake ABC transporter family permease subunit [Catonella massiliensis]MBK5896981.1 iron chelate uptake ABC transporter family permease subunit [Catonella massiliensis]